MATITDKRSINATLSTTTVDRAQLLQFWDYIEVYNGEASGGDMVYITDDGATDPVAAAEGTMSVAPGERLVFKARPLTSSIPDGSAVICHEIRVLGNGGLYSVLGLGSDRQEAGSYTDEEAQDAVGTILVDGTTVDLTYNDGTPSITAEVTAGSLTNTHINASAAIALSKLAVDPLARANHTGTQAGTTVDAATTSVRGTVPLATATEVLTGTDTGRAPTPSVLAPFAAHTRVSGALAETVPRHFPDSAITLTSGRLHLVAISLPAGLTITSITFVSGAGLSGLSNQWFGLFDSSLVPLRLTGDDTSTAWALNTAKTLNLSSTYATTTAGLYYLGICVVASGMGTIAAQASTAIMTGFAPIISGSSSTGLTNPASCPNPAGALTATSTIPFAYVS